MESIGKTKQSFKEFQEEIKDEMNQNLFLSKIFTYADMLKDSIVPGSIFCPEEENIRMGTKEWFQKLATTETLITAESFGANFIKRDDQTIRCKNPGVYDVDPIKKELKIRCELQEGIYPQKKKLLYVANFQLDVGQLISLLDDVDYEQYDVTLMPLRTNQNDQRLKLVHPKVRILTRYGRAIYTREEYEKFLYLGKYLFCADDIEGVIERELGELLKKENQRIHGNMRFDELFVFGDFLPMDYILFAKIEAKKRTYIQTAQLETMRKNWRTGKYTGRYSDFEVNHRIGLMENFDQILCLSKGLLQKEKVNGKYSFYDNAGFLPVRRDKTRNEKRQPAVKVMYGEDQYFGYDMEEVTEGSIRVNLLPVVPEGKRAWYHLVEDLSGDSLDRVLQKFRDEVAKDETDMLFIIDNFQVINEVKEVCFKRWSLEERIVVLRDVKIHPEYMEQFQGSV